MKLQSVNKARYRKHLNVVIAAMIISLMVLGITFGQILITVFSDGQGSNFSYNLMGVIGAVLICVTAMNSVKHHEFMTEVYYVWQLKQSLNAIHRRLKKLEDARDQDNINAFIILNYYYAGSEQLLKLDDNTITMDSLNKNKQQLLDIIKAKNLDINENDYDPELLNEF